MKKRAIHVKVEHGKHKALSHKSTQHTLVHKTIHKPKELSIEHKGPSHISKKELMIDHKKPADAVKKELQAAINEVKEGRRGALESRITRIAMSNQLMTGLLDTMPKKPEPKNEIDQVREFLKKESAKKKLFTNVSPGKEFFLANGGVVRNLHELSNAILYMDEHTFTIHVNGFKNDFSRWIHDVHKDVELSQKLALSKDRGENAAIMFKHFFEKVK